MMAKKGKPTPPRRLVEGTYQASELLEKGRPAEALTILKELDSRYPNRLEVLSQLVTAYSDLKDQNGYEYALWRMYRQNPANPDLLLALGGAYLANLRPALARRTFHEFLRRWPGHTRVARVRKDLVLIEKSLQAQAAEMELPEEQANDLVIQLEELRFCLAHAEYRQGRQIAEKILRQQPDFVPALNNLGQIYAVEGQLERSIEVANHVLQIDPDNIHALSNLARLNFLAGHLEEAYAFGERLKRSTAEASDRWTKIAEALTFLEDDQGVLALYEQAEAARELEPPEVDELFYHLLATAAAWLGNDDLASRYWRKALKINQNFEWARENLADLEKPASQRSGPWAHPLESWLLAPFVHDTVSMLNVKRSTTKTGLQAQVNRLITEKYPRIIFLAPHLIGRGDQKAREFVVRLAAVSAQPVLVEAAKAFVTGKRGSFDERMHAGQILSQADLLEPGMVRMWTDGEWHEMLMLNMEIDPEPTGERLPKRVQELSLEAYEALNLHDGRRAQIALEKALAIRPDDPALLNNLCIAFDQQGEKDRALELAREIHVRFPDYFFGIISSARQAMQNGDLDQAHNLLNGLMQRKKLHTSEFTTLCVAQFDVWIVDKDRNAAQTWMDMLAKVDPENPNLPDMRRRVGKKLPVNK